MIKHTFIFLIALIPIYANGQEFGIIDDKDGYTNIREKPSLDSRVIGRIFENDIFFCAKVSGSDWYEVSYGGQISKLLDKMQPHQREYYIKELHYKSNSVEVEGYVHKSRIVFLSTLQKLNDENSKPKNGELTVQNDTLLFQISVGKFDRTKHEIEKSTNGYVHKIDGLQPKGVIDTIPKIETKNIRLRILSKDISIPKTEYSDLYEIDLSSLSLRIDKKGTIYILAYGSDGFAGYSVVWIIKNGKYLKREISTS